MAPSRNMVLGLDARLVDKESRERPILIALFLMIYISYGALGRDVFFNALYQSKTQVYDPIGYALPWVRAFVCALTVFLVVCSTSVTWALSKIPLWFAPFCVLALASAFWSADFKDTLRTALCLMMMWLAMPLVVHRLGLVVTVQATLHLMAVVLILSAALAIFVPSIGRHTGTELVQYAHAGRWRGIFGHKNGLGPWACCGSVFFVTHWRLCTGPRLYWWVARASAVACLLFSGAATALVVAVLLYILWVGFMMLRRFRLSAVLGAMGLALALGTVVYTLFSSALFALIGRDETLTGRTGLWDLATQLIAERPWFGSGFQSTGGAEWQARMTILYGDVIQTPDNAYFYLLMSLGIAGCVLYAAAYIAAIRNGFEWLKYVGIDDRAAIEFGLLVMMSTLVQGITDATAMICTGFDGVIAFSVFFALLTTPRSPDSRMRGEFRLAQHRLPPAQRARRPSRPSLASKGA